MEEHFAFIYFQRNSPGVPIVLAGTKLDLVNDQQELNKLAKRGQSPITVEMVCFVCWDNCPLPFLSYMYRENSWHPK